jgi:O-antigen/teichoic acid export membrane protein
VAAYSGAQAVVLLLNAFSGFLLVRGMSKEQYAWFTIANSLQATISVMSDSGLGSAMMAVGGRVCEDRSRFAALMHMAHGLRFRFMLMAALVTLPAGWWVLAKNDAPWWVIVVLMVLVTFTSVRSVESVVLNTVNRLHGRVRHLLEADLTVSLSRLALVALGMLPGLTAILGAAATAVSQWMQTSLLRRQTTADMADPGEPDPAWKPEFEGAVKNLFPLCLFNCVQGHITTWILSLFAATEDVADVGALARLGIVFTFLGLPLAQLILPRIARTQEPRRLLRLCLLTLGGILSAALVLAGLGIVFADQVLWLLGSQYAHLHRELAWFLGYLVLGTMANAAWGLCYTRNWVRHAWLQIPFAMGAQALAACWLDLGRVSHAIVFSGLSNLTGLLIAVYLVVRGLKAARQAASARIS